MEKRTEAIIIGIVAAGIASGIAYSYYEGTQDKLEVAFRYPEDQESVFEIPQIIVNGTARPLYNDTAERKVVLITNPEEADKENIGIGYASFDFCRDAQAFENNRSDTLAIGEDDNPATVNIGSTEPTIIQFCAYNTKFNATDFENTEGLSYLRYLRIKEEIQRDIPNVKTSLEGLEFGLSTRVIDPPPVRITIVNQTSQTFEVVKERIYLYVYANENASIGTHLFFLDASHPRDETGTAFEGGGIAVYVYVQK